LTKKCDSSIEAYPDELGEEPSRNMITKLKDRIHCFILEVKTAKGPARIDLAGRLVLLIPAFASVFIISFILGLLFYEAMPILVHPDGGPGIIVDPNWGPTLPENPTYGILVFIAGSMMCSMLAIIIAVPLGVAGAIFLSEFCPKQLRDAIRVVIEMMAAIPSIIYGLWAFTVLVPWVRDSFAPFIQNNPLTGWMPWFQGATRGLSLFTGGLILAIMLLPTVVTVSNDALDAVPRTYREASLALGATTSETARKIVLSAALPGVGAAIVLSLGRAVGETMAILMVTGNSRQIPLTLFDPCYVMTSIIANQLGAAYIEPLWRSALFAVALVLMMMSVGFTLIAKLFIRWGMKTRGMV
jgi:phosphate transport system permease protein